MGGSTDREGRVEVCDNKRWRTVCTGSQELAGAICSQMGYIFEGKSELINLLSTNDPSIESTVANSFPPGAFPEYRLNCTQLSNGKWHCTPVEQQCDSFMELGVVCISYEEFDQRSRNRTLSTQLPPIEYTPSNERGTICADNSTTFIVGIIVFVILQVATMIALISTCVVFKTKLKQK